MNLSPRIYGGLLSFYPSDLRRDFGTEMRELFSEDLADARRERGIAGVIGVWWCALCEFLRIALPGLQSNQAFTVPALAFAFTVLWMGGELAAGAAHLHEVMPFRQAAGIILFPSLVVATAAIAVVHTGKVRVLSLDLQSA